VAPGNALGQVFDKDYHHEFCNDPALSSPLVPVISSAARNLTRKKISQSLPLTSWGLAPSK